VTPNPVDCSVLGPEKGGKNDLRGNCQHQQITQSMQYHQPGALVLSNRPIRRPPTVHQLHENGPWAKRETQQYRNNSGETTRPWHFEHEEIKQKAKYR